MRIALTGNVFPFGIGHAYGGERILGYLAQALVKRGHEIYLFAREGTNVPEATDYVPVGPLTNACDVHFDAAKAYFEQAGFDPDVYFCGYFGEGWYPETQEQWPYCELTWNVWCHAKWQLKQTPFNVVSYSRILQEDFRRQGVETTMIHYGLPKDLYAFQSDKEDYACWIGKLEGGKAPRIGIELAKAAGIKLVIMGPPYNTGTFWNEVCPHIDNEQVFWVRGVDDQMKYEIMSKAKCLIYSNDNSWKEHFGIVIAESLAMGTPVVGMNRINQDCSIVVDKIVEHGKHGFILNYRDSNDLIDILNTGVPLIRRINEIDPAACREQFEKRFTADLMAKRYEWLFERIAQGERFSSVEVPF
jgi:glycosyltransferase involved in cell wall biosynthesis